MRRVPSIINPSRLDPCSTVVDLLIQVTSKQAKAHGGAPNPNVDIYQNALIRAHDNFGNELEELKELFHIDKKNQNLSKVMRNFGEAIKCAYLLGSASPEPAMQSRTTKAMEVRKQGWEEPLDKAIEKAVLSNPGASYKFIDRLVRAEMKKQKIKIPEKDAFMRKRIGEHMEMFKPGPLGI